MPSPDIARTRLLQIYAAAVDAVQGQRCVRDYLSRLPAVRTPPGSLPPRHIDPSAGGGGATLSQTGPVYVIALGKAACSMARGALDVLNTRIARAYVVTKEGYDESLPWPCHTAGHPLPDERSLSAGTGLLEFIAALPRDAEVLVLLSGGASTLVESPAPGVDLARLRAANEWLLASGLDITQCNRVRKSLSLIKGGRLAARLAPRPVLCLAISDVPGNDAAIIASGPLVEDTQHSDTDIPGLPDFLRRSLLHPPPRPERNVFRAVRMDIIATLDQAKTAAAAAATQLGYHAILHPALVTGDAAAAGGRLAQQLRAAEPGDLHIWGGETTVRLPPSPGRGGRNQHLALAAALSLQGDANVLLLAAATDGSDGPGEDAGALVDGDSVARARLHGVDAATALAAADAGSLLAASGDLITTGPTGTNVTDIMLGLKY
jgi:hydroxypyruvate reductase